MPAAWTKVPDSRLIEAGIGPGYINSIVAVFQAKMVQRCGTAFVKRMQGTTKTDEQVAQELVKLKHVPQPPRLQRSQAMVARARGGEHYLHEYGELGTHDSQQPGTGSSADP